MTRRRALLLSAAALLAGAAALRPVVVKTEGGSRLLVLARGQAGRIRFVNSVTGRPVEIDFRIGARFEDFRMRTDAGTEEYYTAGLYDVNDVASRDSVEALRFCSINGIHLTLGYHELEVRDGCLEVTLPWTSTSRAPTPPPTSSPGGSWSSPRSSGRCTTCTSSSTPTRRSPGSTSRSWT